MWRLTEIVGSRILLFAVGGLLAACITFLPAGFPQEVRIMQSAAGISASQWQAAPGQPFRIDPSQMKNDYPGLTGWSADLYIRSLSDFLAQLLPGTLTETLPVTPFTFREVKVITLVLEGWLYSVGLFLFSLLTGALVGCGLGIAASTHRWMRMLSQPISIAGLTIPDFMLVQFGWMVTIWSWTQFGWRPWSVGTGPSAERWWMLPWLVLSTVALGYFARTAMVALDRTISMDFIRTATAKGLPKWKVIGKHAFRSALPQILDSTPPVINRLLSSLLVVELLTGIPGVARWMVMVQRPSIAATGVLVFCAWYCLLDVLVQAIRGAADPRTRGESSAQS